MTLILWLIGLALIYAGVCWLASVFPNVIKPPFVKIILVVLVIWAIYLILLQFGVLHRLFDMPSPRVP